MSRARGAEKGTLVVSLDFEMYWGVHDLVPLEARRYELAKVRRAIDRILDLFETHEIHATWATVGLLFFENRGDLASGLPDLLPNYAEPHLSPYPGLREMGSNEAVDPYRYARSVISDILDTPYQEIGTHTFSHYYCLEPGQSKAEFRADLEAAVRVARGMQVDLRSLVFPRNQVQPEYLSCLRELGMQSYRGNQNHWAYKDGNRRGESPFRRAFRLLDAYVNLSGHHTWCVEKAKAETPVNLPASRLLRRYTPKLGIFEPLRLRRICSGLDHAAEHGAVYHLWFHPEELSVPAEPNLAALTKVIEHFARLRDRGRMESLNMQELAGRATGTDSLEQLKFALQETA